MPDFRHYFWTSGEPWRTLRSFLVPRLLQVLHSALMCTLRIQVSGAGIIPGYLEGPDHARGVLFVTWHDTTLIPLHVFRRQNLGVMMSTSRSGQIQAAFWSLHGWPTVWGSTKKREGIQALREVLRRLRSGQSFAFTPDGPKGPRHHAQPGVIYLATNAPAPIIPVGVAASPAWRLPTWDKYLIPRPFSRVHVHLAEPLVVPPQLPRDETPQWQEKIAAALDAAEAEAARRLTQR